jgi:hypothetical protein
MNRDYERERVVAIRAVREAARLCRAVGAEISPEALAKKDKSPVTVADFGSQALICRALAEAFPDDPVIAEEDSIELRRQENAPILDQVVKHVRAVQAETGEGAEIDIDSEQVCGWIDRGGTGNTSSGSGRSTRSMGPKGSSAANSTPSRWRWSSTVESWSPPWPVRTSGLERRPRSIPTRAWTRPVRSSGPSLGGVPMKRRASSSFTLRPSPIQSGCV